MEFRRNFAEQSGENEEAKLDERAVIPLDEHAFIIDQLKRPEEIELLIKAFGKRFVQVSVVTPWKREKSLLKTWSRLRSWI